MHENTIMQRASSWEELNFLVHSAGVSVEQALGLQDDQSQGEQTDIRAKRLIKILMLGTMSGECSTQCYLEIKEPEGRAYVYVKLRTLYMSTCCMMAQSIAFC